LSGASETYKHEDSHVLRVHEKMLVGVGGDDDPPSLRPCVIIIDCGQTFVGKTRLPQSRAYEEGNDSRLRGICHNDQCLSGILRIICRPVRLVPASEQPFTGNHVGGAVLQHHGDG